MITIRQLLCGLKPHGHAQLLQFESGRMFLRCVDCGHETPGWQIKDPAPASNGPKTLVPRISL